MYRPGKQAICRFLSRESPANGFRNALDPVTTTQYYLLQNGRKKITPKHRIGHFFPHQKVGTGLRRHSGQLRGFGKPPSCWSRSPSAREGEINQAASTRRVRLPACGPAFGRTVADTRIDNQGAIGTRSIPISAFRQLRAQSSRAVGTGTRQDCFPDRGRISHAEIRANDNPASSYNASQYGGIGSIEWFDYPGLPVTGQRTCDTVTN